MNRDGQAESTEPEFDVGDIFSPCCEKMNARVAEGAHWDDGSLVLKHRPAQSEIAGSSGSSSGTELHSASYGGKEMPVCRGRGFHPRVAGDSYQNRL